MKNRWNAKTYKRYQVSLRLDEDAELIDFVEQNRKRYNPVDYFRAGIEQIKKEGS